MTELVADPAATSTGADTTAEGTTPEGSSTTTTEKPEGETAVTETEATEVVYDFKVPEGIELDAASADSFKAIAKELKLPADAAQKVVDFAIKRDQDAIANRDATVQSWVDQVKADKELGGDKLEQTLATAKKAIDLGGPELTELLNVSKLGNHPAVVKWAHTIGKALSEDRFVTGSKAPAESGKTLEERLYPNHK